MLRRDDEDDHNDEERMRVGTVRDGKVVHSTGINGPVDNLPYLTFSFPGSWCFPKILKALSLWFELRESPKFVCF